MTPDDVVYGHELQPFEARASSDEVKSDLELTCTFCGEHLCDIEAGDELHVLVSIALAHECDERESDG